MSDKEKLQKELPHYCPDPCYICTYVLLGNQMPDNGKESVDGHESCRSELAEVRRILREHRDVLEKITKALTTPYHDAAQRYGLAMDHLGEAEDLLYK